MRIQHGLNELAGGLYGRVLAFYSKGRTLPAPLAAIAEDVMREKLAKSYLSPAQKHLLPKQQAEIPVKMRTALETAFRAWKAAAWPSARIRTPGRWEENSKP